MTKPNSKLFLFFSFLLGISFSLDLFAIEVRILVIENRSSIHIEGESIIISAKEESESDFTSLVMKKLAGNEGITLKLFQKKISAEQLTPKLFDEYSIISNDRIIRLNGETYTGLIKIYVRENRLIAVNILDLEEYLIGVVSQEISPSWSDETIKAQAVIARTYAFYKLRNSFRPENRYDLKSSTMHQVFKGGINSDRLKANIEKTSGLVMLYKGKLIEAFYHSCCGGISELPKAVWGGSNLPYYSRVKCKYCIESPNYFWDYKIAIPEMQNILNSSGFAIDKIFSIVINRKTESNRNESIKFKFNRKDGISIKCNQFRQIIGFNKIKSTNFKVYYDQVEKTIQFLGNGAGHGVGLCQWGAEKMAILGKSFREIIDFYYRNIELEKYNNTSMLNN